MTPTAAKVLQEALALPAEERAELADMLLSSLGLAGSRIDRLWAQEAVERLDAFGAVLMDAIPAEDVFKELEDR